MQNYRIHWLIKKKKRESNNTYNRRRYLTFNRINVCKDNKNWMNWTRWSNRLFQFSCEFGTKFPTFLYSDKNFNWFRGCCFAHLIKYGLRDWKVLFIWVARFSESTRIWYYLIIKDCNSIRITSIHHAKTFHHITGRFFSSMAYTEVNLWSSFHPEIFENIKSQREFFGKHGLKCT